MIYLFLSILASSFIFLIFNQFNRFGVNNFKAIVVNYGTAGLLGLLLSKGQNWEVLLQTEVLMSIALLAVLFISLFNVMAKTTQVNGASVAVISNKLSVVIPFVFAILFLHEELTSFKVLGLTFAMVGVFFSLFKSGQNWKKSFILPITLFIGSGLLDGILKWNQTSYLEGDEMMSFSSAIFFSAYFLGSLYMLFTKKGVPTKVDLRWGVLLGIVNFFSIYLIMLVLEVFEGNSSMAFPINNLSVVLLTTMLSFLLLKEKLEKKNWMGIGLAVVGIFILGLEHFLIA